MHKSDVTTSADVTLAVVDVAVVDAVVVVAVDAPRCNRATHVACQPVGSVVKINGIIKAQNT